MNSKQSILLVEPDQGLEDFLIQLFHKEYAIQTAADAVETLHYLYQGNLPDLLIIDLNLVGISGQELINQIKTNGITKNIPVIALCGSNYHEEDMIVVSNQIKFLAKKPFDPNDLIVQIRKAILS
ncbi:MAG: response regulator [Bacteroidota bacterium]